MGFESSTAIPASFVSRLDYPGIGPEHSYLSDIGRAEYFAVTDEQALEAFQMVSRLEGIIPALETSHAFAYLKVRPHATKLRACHGNITACACKVRLIPNLHVWMTDDKTLKYCNHVTAG